MTRPPEARSESAFDEGETVAYTGPRLTELLASLVTEALPEIEVDIEETVVMPGSRRSGAIPTVALHAGYLQDTLAPVSVAPTAYTLSREVAVEPRRQPAPSRVLTSVFLGALGLLIGSVAGRCLMFETNAVARVAARQVEVHERVDEKRSLVVFSCATAPEKRTRRLVFAGTRMSAPVVAAPRTAPASAPPASQDEASADERLIRAAQSERPL